MSQVSSGGEGSDKRPGTPPRKAASPNRPAAKAAGASKGRQNGPGSKGRPPGGQNRGPKPQSGGAGGKGRAPRQNTTISARPPGRFSPSTIAFGSIALVVVIVVVFVIIKVTSTSSGGNNPHQTLLAPVPASAHLVSTVTGVTPSVIDAVGTGSGVTAPSVVKNQPALTSGGKPEVLFIGAEFCPLCAAERWAMVQAFSRFGTWSGLETTSSSPWDSAPDTPTFSFRSAKYTSPYVDFVFVEHETNDNNGPGTRKLFQPLTTAENNLWNKYSAQLLGSAPGFPFVDFGNKYFVTSNSYDPTLLQGLTQQEVANKLSNPTDPVTEGIMGTANYLTAAICALTNNQPASVCSASGVQKAAAALKSS
jgi:hypothetical protein